ncbi:hypothetical protein [Pseudothermotoga sp.]|uniref:hypothetical protein n=1 Tax=Pseudothermotoga sp. TaxID=2033661 RepID=UPI0031F5F2F4
MAGKKIPSFNISLRKGFFKNELFKMCLSNDDIIFKCLQDKSKNFTTPLEKVTKIAIYEGKSREIEIRTKNEVIFGNFNSTRTLNRAINIFGSFFGEKFSRVCL